MAGSFIKTWVRRESVASTSDLARELVSLGELDLPLLVLAKRQTQGRGRGAHTWWSDAGSLTFTLVIDPAAHGLSAEHEPRVALTAAVAVIEAIAPIVGPGRAGIRWPNDIELGGRKLGGILPERLQAPHGPRLAIGIGLNVRTQLERAPAEVRRLAASLHELVGPETSTEQVLEAILDRLPDALAKLARADLSLADEWARLDTLLGEPVRIALGDRIVAGLGRGIDAEGALCLAVEREVLRIFGGQVLRDPG
jgi:BirA family biotin operon repressor/biotin-[acetyl-CoA-carboxylase] ligase